MATSKDHVDIVYLWLPSSPIRRHCFEMHVFTRRYSQSESMFNAFSRKKCLQTLDISDYDKPTVYSSSFACIPLACPRPRGSFPAWLPSARPMPLFLPPSFTGIFPPLLPSTVFQESIKFYRSMVFANRVKNSALDDDCNYPQDI